MSTEPQSTNLPPASEPPTAHISVPRSQAPPVDLPSMEVDEPAASQTVGTNVPVSTMQLQGMTNDSVAPAPSLPPPTSPASGLWGWEVGAYAVMHPTTTCEICRAYLEHTDIGDATFAVVMHARQHHEEHLASNGCAVLITCCETIEHQFAECTDDLVHEEKRCHRYKAECDEA